jgi:predicted Zn finger-like uncharacterized protein
VIVTCEECQTQFRLGDAKVPETGIRVRCSRCKCAFFVESPHKPAPDQAEDLAREALGAEPIAAAQPPSEASQPDEESDWQFNEDIDPVLGAGESQNELAAARDAVDDLLGGAPAVAADPDPDPVTGATAANETSDSGFDLAADDFAGDDDSDFDTIDPVFADAPSSEFEFTDEPEDDPNAVTIDRGVFSESLADPGADSGLDLDPAPEPEPEPELAGDSGGEPLIDYPDEEASQEAAAADDSEDPFGETAEDLGSPADWDFFEEGDTQPSAGVAPTRDAFDAGAEVGAAAPFDVAGAFATSELATDPETDVSAGDIWFTRMRGVLGWALVSSLCLFAIAVALFPGAMHFAPEAAPIRIAGLETVRLEGRWVENAVAGPVYVVSGAFHSTGEARPADGSVLRVRLLDARGNSVTAETAAVGAPIQTARLRESNPRDLSAAQERSAPSILGDPLARRKRRPFMALLGDVPSGAVAFEFQVAEARAPISEIDAAPVLDAPAAETPAAEGSVTAPEAEPVAIAPAVVEPAVVEPAVVRPTAPRPVAVRPAVPVERR